MTFDLETTSLWVSCVFDDQFEFPNEFISARGPLSVSNPEVVTLLWASAFENSGRFLSPLPAELLSDRFFDHFVQSPLDSNWRPIADPAVPLAARLRLLHSLVPLFEQVMAQRCAPCLGHCDEGCDDPLNECCYMWWERFDMFSSSERWPQEDVRAAEIAAINVMCRILAIPHDACRESALHGLGHWCRSHQEAAEVVDAFLLKESGLRPELKAYATRARLGLVL